MANIKNELRNLVPKIFDIIVIFSYVFLRFWVARSSNSDLGGAEKRLESADLAMLS